MNEIYEKIIKKIRANGLKQEDLGEKLGINQSSVSKNLISIKNGKCSVETLFKICEKLGLEIKVQEKK